MQESVFTVKSFKFLLENVKGDLLSKVQWFFNCNEQEFNKGAPVGEKVFPKPNFWFALSCWAYTMTGVGAWFCASRTVFPLDVQHLIPQGLISWMSDYVMIGQRSVWKPIDRFWASCGLIY